MITIQEVSCNYKKKQFKNNSSPEDEEIGRKVLLGLKKCSFKVSSGKQKNAIIFELIFFKIYSNNY